MNPSVALALIFLGAPHASSAVIEIRSAKPSSFSAPNALLPGTPFVPSAVAVSPLAAPALAAIPAPLTAPAPLIVPVPSAAPALAVLSAPASPRRSLSLAAESGPEAPDAFDGRSTKRLRVLSAEELGVSDDPDAPRPAPQERAPFLYRHPRLVRAIGVPILKSFYRVRVNGVANLPRGPILIVPNHVSFLDPILVAFAADRPLRFLMYRPIYETYGFQWLFRSLGAIPISTKDPKDVIENSLNRARAALAAGESVVIFPEGQVTRDGNFGIFRRGFERIAAGLGVPVVPARVDGMWGSALSRHPAKSWLRSVLRRLRGRRNAAVRFGPPLERPDAALARDAVSRLIP